MWVFGYGSLIWKVDFPYQTKIVGYIKGYDRKFYQHSTDHRGTPEQPGRVVTLVPSTSDSEVCVWGIAYKIRDEDIQEVVNHLDYREKGGYQRMKVLFYPSKSELDVFEITIYVGTRDNLNWAGEADDLSIARQIAKSVGPSGSNVEYICNLAKAMREIAPHIHDEHLFSIEQKVLDCLKENL